MQYRVLDFKLNDIRFIKNIKDIRIFINIDKICINIVIDNQKKIYLYKCFFYFKFIFEFNLLKIINTQ